MAERIKKSIYGLMMFVFTTGIIALLISLFLNIKNFQIALSQDLKDNNVLVLIVHFIIVLFLVALLFLILSKNKIGVFFAPLTTSVLFFFIPWLPLYRTTDNLLVVYAIPGGIAVIMAFISLLLSIFRAKLDRIEREINKSIHLIFDIFTTYWRLNYGKNQDKTIINPRDGIKRQEETKYYRINYKIKEHDK